MGSCPRGCFRLLTPLAYPLLEHLFQRPIVSVRSVEQHLSCTYGQANNVIARFEQLGILAELTGQRRNRIWRYSPYVRMFPTDAAADDLGESQGTSS